MTTRGSQSRKAPSVVKSGYHQISTASEIPSNTSVGQSEVDCTPVNAAVCMSNKSSFKE